MLLIICGQRTLSILCRKLFINTMMVVVVLQVSAPYGITVLMFVLKILTLIFVDSNFEFYMFFDCRNAVLALPILAFASEPDRSYSSMMLFRDVKFSLLPEFILQCVGVLCVEFEVDFSPVYVEAY
ncbi:unnamed protein product [Schistosoma mattheei]|uniref:Uncharacterized protein n=1 Tax=Schistosoma mattheei TaxID=31246 RepID=A0A3P7Z3M5_9TREM|nr:unnamed protein product [Schistosoma mattheei]